MPSRRPNIPPDPPAVLQALDEQAAFIAYGAHPIPRFPDLREVYKPPLTIMVTGSRAWTDPEPIARALARHRDQRLEQTVIHGDARGVDTIASSIAYKLGYQVQAHPVQESEWRTQGRAAGPLRNQRMLDEQPDLVLAFQQDASIGTQHAMNEARRRGIPVELCARRGPEHGLALFTSDTWVPAQEEP